MGGFQMKFKTALILLFLSIVKTNYSSECYPENVDWKAAFQHSGLSVDELLDKLEDAVVSNNFFGAEFILKSLDLGHKVFQDVRRSTKSPDNVPEFARIYLALQRIKNLTQNLDIRELFDIEMAIFELRNTPLMYTAYGKIRGLGGRSRPGMRYLALFNLEEALRLKDAYQIEESAAALNHFKNEVGGVGKILQETIDRVLSRYQQYKSRIEYGAGGAAGP